MKALARCYLFLTNNWWKLWVGVITGGFLLAYAQLRLTMNVEYAGATWQDLVELQAERPFGLRMLVPWLSRPWVRLLDGNIWPVFLGFEFLFAGGLWGALYAIFRKQMSTILAHAAASGFFLILVIPFMLAHRWPVFYPADTASMFFIALACFLLIRRQWMWLTVVTAVATLNRETAALIPLLVALFWGTTKYRREALVWAARMLVVYLAVRWGVGQWLDYLPGEALRLTLGPRWRLQSNLEWLESPRHWMLFLSYFAFLPAWWTVLFPWIPSAWRNIRYVAAAYFCGLLVVGNMYEPRIFGEILVMLYIPAMIGFYRLAEGQDLALSVSKNKEVGWGQKLLDRPGVSILLGISLAGAIIFLQIYPIPG